LNNPPGTSNGPTEAINGHHDHIHRSALEFNNPTNSTTRSFLETGSLTLNFAESL